MKQFNTLYIKILSSRKLPVRDGNFFAPDFAVDPANWSITRLLKGGHSTPMFWRCNSA